MAPSIRCCYTSDTHPSLSLLSPAEFNRNRPSLAEAATALLGFGPFQRPQLWKPGSLGLASPDTFRLQGFSPSCRFTSSRTFGLCFMPLPLIGFSFRAFPPGGAFGPFQNRSPSWRWCEPGHASGEPRSTQNVTPPSRSCSPSGFATSRVGVSRTRGGRCPRGFPASREFPLATACRLRDRSPRGLRNPTDDMRGTHEVDRTLPFRVLTAERSACLLRDCRPFWLSCTSSHGCGFNATLWMAYGFTLLLKPVTRPRHSSSPQR